MWEMMKGDPKLEKAKKRQNEFLAKALEAEDEKVEKKQKVKKRRRLKMRREKEG